MPFWKRREQDPTDSAEPAEPLDPKAFLALMDALGESCADEVERLGGDREQVLGTVWFTELQEVSRVQLTSDGIPLSTSRKLRQRLTDEAAPLRVQPAGGRLDRLEVTVADGRLSTEVTYRD